MNKAKPKFKNKTLLKKILAFTFIFMFLMSCISVNAFAASEWESNTFYKVGDIVTYNGTTYECIQAHTTLPNWQPSIVPALWNPIKPNIIPDPDQNKSQNEETEQGFWDGTIEQIKEYFGLSPNDDETEQPEDSGEKSLTDQDSQSTPNSGPAVVITSGSKTTKQVALTFDDGPNNQYTPQILDILKEQNVKATFFVLGNMVESNPEVAKRIVNEGHVIANHSWNHPHLPQIAKTEIDKELNRTHDIVKSVTGKQMKLMRPPYGEVNEDVLSVLGNKGLSVINWDVDTGDWTGKKPEEITNTVKSNIQSGSIILMHDAGGDRSATVQALPSIISELKSQGYTLVTVDQLLNTPAYNTDSVK